MSPTRLVTKHVTYWAVASSEESQDKTIDVRTTYTYLTMYTVYALLRDRVEIVCQTCKISVARKCRDIGTYSPRSRTFYNANICKYSNTALQHAYL